MYGRQGEFHLEKMSATFLTTVEREYKPHYPHEFARRPNPTINTTL